MRAPEAMQSLIHLENFSNENYSFRELPHCHRLLIRGNPNDAHFMSGVKKATGIELPTNPYQALIHDADNIVFNMTPDEWWLHCQSSDDFNKFRKNLGDTLSNIHAAVVDISDYYTMLELEGDDLPKLLQKNSCFNFHPENFSKGDAVSTRYASCNIHVYAKEQNLFHVQIRWSHAEYFWDMLAYSATLSIQNH
ncbi:MAG: sarcosine oxidase subunit gamma family protein [Alphaproteobacteria bacterium]|nr:sarcosine oxidase subunit gamma family protein [Alphaproteobacteria bacterium]